MQQAASTAAEGSITTNPYDRDGGNAALWGILGFFVPLAGLILFLCLEKRKAQRCQGRRLRRAGERGL